MSAQILAFPGRVAPIPVPAADVLAIFDPAWQGRHLPLVEAALDLIQADDAELRRRCAAMRDADGERMAAALTFQLEVLAGEVMDVAEALLSTASRVRGAMAAG